jgi:hypothetical protein
MVIPCDQYLGVHSLTAILTEVAKYEADHGTSKFVRPSRLPIYNRNIVNDSMTVVHVCAKAAYKSRLDNYASYKAAKCGIAKILLDIVDEIWYNNLKDAKTFYMKVMALEIMAHLNANSGGLHAIDMISLRSNMIQYYVQVDGIPQFIVMMKDAQKKAKRAGMPIANVELVMMALVAILQSNTSSERWMVERASWSSTAYREPERWPSIWPTSNTSTNIKRGGPLGSTYVVIPAPATTIVRLGTALKYLALAAANDTTVLQKLTASNLALFSLVIILTAANKKLAEALAKAKLTNPPATMPGAPRPARSIKMPFPGNYCWMHDH